jgi:hypothetical protein
MRGCRSWRGRLQDSGGEDRREGALGNSPFNALAIRQADILADDDESTRTAMVTSAVVIPAELGAPGSIPT